VALGLPKSNINTKQVLDQRAIGLTSTSLPILPGLVFLDRVDLSLEQCLHSLRLELKAEYDQRRTQNSGPCLALDVEHAILQPLRPWPKLTAGLQKNLIDENTRARGSQIIFFLSHQRDLIFANVHQPPHAGALHRHGT
jgi:hypothetical protein